MNTQRTASLVIVVAAFAVGNVVNSYLPNLDTILIRPFPATASVDEAIHMRSGEVVVSDVAVSKQVEYQGTMLSTEQAFVSATVRLEPSGATSGVGDITITGGDGKLYGGAQQYAATPQCIGSQPGIPLRCRVFVEVSSQAVDGASMQLHNFASTKGDEVVHVDLALGNTSPTTAVPTVGTREFGG